MTDAVEVFVSYSHKDEAWRDQLAAHLKLLERQGIISAWHDRKILPGSEWQHDISHALSRADIILLLISADFLASDYVWDVEIKKALERHAAGDAIVIPVILRPVDWSVAPFSQLQALPQDGRPLVKWTPPDEGLMDVASGIRTKATELRTARRTRQERAQKQAALTQYRDVVRSCLVGGEISEIARENLRDLANELQLSRAETQPIEAEEKATRQAYQDKLNRYRQTFRQAIARQYPLSAQTQVELRERQDLLSLEANDIRQIEAEEVDRWEVQRQPIISPSPQPKPVPAPPLPAPSPKPANPIPASISRRRVLQFAGWGGGGLVIASARPWRFLPLKTQPDPLPMRFTPFDFEVVTLTDPLPTMFNPFDFEVVTLNNKGEIVNRQPGKAEAFQEDLGNGVSLDMVQIPSGEFVMGSPAEELERREYEGPQHKVTVASFWLGKFPVTQAQYQAVMGKNPSRFTEEGASRPVEGVFWQDAVAFCQKLSEQTGCPYRLPSEAEWEYACRAGTTTPFYFGPTLTPEVANYNGTSTYGAGPKGMYRQQTTPVGSFPPNAFGLYDLHGNVSEWCADLWHENYQGAPADGSAWLSGEDSSWIGLRGGSWNFAPGNCRSAFRLWDAPDLDINIIGLRVCCSAPRTV